MKLRHMLVVSAIAAASVLVPVQAAPQDSPANNMQILRDKLKADKKLIVAANMDLTEAEAKAFWPIYDAYQKDLEDLNKRIHKTLKSYADAFNARKVSDATAKKIIREYLDTQHAETKLMQSYATSLNRAIPAIKTMRYLQIENKIRAIIKYDLAAEVPLVL